MALARSAAGASHQQGPHGWQALSPRAADILERVLQGSNPAQIALDIDVPLTDVKAELATVLRALNVTTRTQAVVAAAKLGLSFDAFP